MGCVSSALLNTDDDFSQIGTSSLGHHIVSLTSTTYGLLTLEPRSTSNHQPPTTSPPRPEPPEVINSWELMAGLDPTTDSFRFPTLPQPPPPAKTNKENPNPNPNFNIAFRAADKSGFPNEKVASLIPPNGENRVVIYTTTLRGVRKTFEACNAVRAAIRGLGVVVCERDISMDRGFREELRGLMEGRESGELVLPRVFVKGRYVGGYEEVMRIVEEGKLGELLQGLPKLKIGVVCEGCGGVRFLNCFSCNGSCKLVMVVKEEIRQKHGRTVVVRCPDCNENGLVLCPICS